MCTYITGIKTIPMEKKCKKAKWLSGEALQIAVKIKEEKAKEKRKDINTLITAGDAREVGSTSGSGIQPG